ncbi:MAG: hypothetical protein WBA28_09965 [Microbacteriaceae bacterium]
MKTAKFLRASVAALAAIALVSGCSNVPPPAQTGGPITDNNTVTPQPTAPETTAPGGNSGNQAPSGNDQSAIANTVKVYAGGIFHAVDAQKLESLGDVSKLSLAQIKSVYNPEFMKYMYDEDMPEMAQQAFWGILTMVGGVGALLPPDQIKVEVDGSQIRINGDSATIPGKAIKLTIMGQSSGEDQSDLVLIKHNGVWKIHLSKL